jgi:2-polyprenyl-3-methyl-5-hydroxy-6-metoxy-1,4-benzoquinol methylase
MRREFDASQPERMDLPQAPNAELEEDLLVLGKMNALFGSHSLIRRYARQWFKPGGKYRVLDLCTGGGDVPRMLCAWGAARNVGFQIDAVDFQPGTVEIARGLCAKWPQIRVMKGNATSYTASEPYDAVMCSLALHHFSVEDAVKVLVVSRSVSRRYVLISDLVRTRSAQLAIWALTQFIFRTPMIREDGRVSIRRAFSFREFAELASRAGWPEFHHRKHALFRQALSLD